MHLNIYLFDKMSEIDESKIYEYLDFLTMDRRQKVIRYKNVNDQKLSIAAYLLLKYAMKSEFGIIDEFEFIYGDNRKPYLKDYPNIFFNFSHCKCGVTCVLEECEVGIDIQDITPFDLGIAKKVCCNEEIKELLLSKNKERDFCKIWTSKEAYLKMLGKGITMKLSDINTLDIPKFTFERKDYFITMVTSKCFQKKKDWMSVEGKNYIYDKDSVQQNYEGQVCIKDLGFSEILKAL